MPVMLVASSVIRTMAFCTARVIVGGLCVLRRIRLELRLTAGAAEQHLFAVVRHAMGRVRLRRHAANRILLFWRGAVNGMVMGRLSVHFGQTQKLRSWLHLQNSLHLPTMGRSTQKIPSEE